MKEALITVKGRVQGVFFRATTQEQALALGLTGYAKNLDNCDVEILAQGEDHAINQLILWAKVGPPRASVSSLDVTMREITQKSDDFTII